MIKTKFNIIYLLGLLLFVNMGMAQDTNTDPVKPRFSERLLFGGNLGLNLGSITFIDLSPSVGYKVSETFTAGIGATYQYYSDGIYSTDVYGGRVFAQQALFESLLLYGEYSYSSYKREQPIFGKNRVEIPHFLVGGGYLSKMGSNSFGYILVLFDLINHPLSPYPKGHPFVRAGFMFGG